MKNIEILKLPSSEWQQYKLLRLRALKEDSQAFGSSYADNLKKSDDYWIERLKNVEEGKSWLLFAKVENNLAGMMGGMFEGDTTVSIVSVYVAKEYRGLGISKILMTSLLAEFATNPKIKKITLSVNKIQIPALNLYQGFGFKIVGSENVQLGDGNYYEEYTMEREV